MAPRFAGQIAIFGVVSFVSKSLLGTERQHKFTKFTIFTRKPRNHVRILIYRTWPIVPGFMKAVLKKSRPAEVSKVDDIKIKRNASIFSLNLLSFISCSSLKFFVHRLGWPLVAAKSRCMWVIW